MIKWSCATDSNALLPVLTIAGITVASLIGGALLIEATWPGIALRLQEAINQRDYPVVRGSWW